MAQSVDKSMDKSLSETDISQVGTITPPSYVFRRIKRSRDEMDDSLDKQLGDFKEEMRKMLSFFSEKQGKEIQQINATLKEIQYSNVNIESAIAYLTAQNEDLKGKMVELEASAKENKDYIKILEDKLETMQMSSQKPNFVIKNVPRKTGESKEDLMEMAMCLLKTINCTINKYDIKDIYRTRGKISDKLNTPIIVETGSTLLKTEIMKMGKAFNIKHKSKLCCKHLGFKTQEDTPIFLSEHLTPKGSRLHFLARDLTKSGAFKFCWTAYGKILVKKDEQSPTITIRNEQQIQQLKMNN